ncbi:MAG: DUF342 domain-containing protein [Nitrospirae bacterium]|nr:DUF342 domain-containing protein [Nitrospirota bacterium]
MPDTPDQGLDFILGEGETYSAAVKAGLKQINLPRDQVDIQLVAEPHGAGEKFVVKVAPKSTRTAAPETEKAATPAAAPRSSEPIALNVSDDGYQAYLSFSPQAAAGKLGRDQVAAALKARSVTFGIDQKALQDAISRIEQGVGFEGLLLAVGQRAKAGRDAEIEFKIDISASSAGRVNEKTGNIDFKERDFLKSVRGGDLLAIRRPPVQAVDGRKVNGEAVKMEKAKDSKLVAGKGVVVSPKDDGTVEYRAKEDGTPTHHADRIEVTQTAVIEGDVNYSTGNIRSKGSVHVRGSVSAGFEVHAEGDILVEGTVEGGKIHAGGNVVLKSGVKGGDKGEIIAEGDVSAMYVERARVESRGNVEVKNVILESKIVAGGWVRAIGGKGEIMGGLIQAVQGIEAKKIGSDFSSSTAIEVGRDFFLERDLQEKQAQMNSIKAQLERIQSSMPLPILQSGDLSKVPEAKRPAIQKIIEAWRNLKETERPLAEALAELDSKKVDTSKCSVLVREMLYPRVTVTIGTTKQITDRESRNVRLMEDRAKKEIKYMTR